MFECSECGVSFKKFKSLFIHKEQCSLLKCSKCKTRFKDKEMFIDHVIKCKTVVSSLGDVATFRLHKSAYKGVLEIYVKLGSWSSLENLFTAERQNIINLISHVIGKIGSIKTQVCVLIKFIKQKPDGDTDSTEIYKISQSEPLTHSSQIEKMITKCIENLELVVDQFTQRGSGWVLQTVKMLEIRVGKLKENSGGCSSVKLPLNLIRKRSLVSPVCKSHCFKWAVLIALHPQATHRQRVSKYKKFEKWYKFRDIDPITPFSQINRFEKRNNVSINVYTLTLCKKPKVVPLKINKDRKTSHINLFLFNDHYFHITNFNGFMMNNKSWERFFCYSCLSGFRDQSSLTRHESFCGDNSAQRTILPGTENVPKTCEFTRAEKSISYPYVIYADFEALVIKSENALGASTFEYQKHEACSFGWVVVDWTGKILFNKFYRGDDAAENFIRSLYNVQASINLDLMRRIKPPILTSEERIIYELADICHVCLQPLFQDKVLDHCHLTGKLRGAAHNLCNLKLRLPNRIPVIFHNLKGYDAHLIMKGIKSNQVKKISVIPQNSEKYIAFFMDDFIFLDSLAFLLSSLDTLANNLPDEDKTKYLSQMFNSSDIPLLLSKGCLPYEYMDSWSKFDDVNLPSIDKFYSHLCRKTIDESTYSNLQRIWNHFNCQNLGDFHDIYLKVDVLLLAAIFENFRFTSLKQFGLDPCHYFSTPGLTWDAALKATKT
ncbi:uncharacterized protein LOC128393666 [Panonychus citri]|uniref:uncharacterized protein LOC128393666 n=1 Tax=Panonychus citri TaxID=50023 RepID=UPI002307F3C2|nr:uncharacterized protein LOC128393666 [Panonychus citri]